MLVAAPLFIDSSLYHSFRCPHRELFFSHNQFVVTVLVAQELVGFCKLEFIGLNVRRGLPYSAKGVIALLKTNISLASIYNGLN